MKRLVSWLLSHRRSVLFALCGVPALALLIWALSYRSVALMACVVIWLGHMALGVVAVVAGMRLWPSRHVPLLWKLWLYINAFLIDVVSGIVLLFVARGVRFTWKFTAVMFVSTLLSDIVRSPLLLSLVRGQASSPASTPEVETSGQMPPQVWHERFDRLEQQVQEIAVQLQELKLQR